MSVNSAGQSGTKGSTRAPSAPMLLCPYCGAATPHGTRCIACRGLLDPLSRQASQNAMGPWFVRDIAMPFMPGCSYETLVGMVTRGKITRRSVLRGPTTRQFWCTAERTPGVSHLLGVCHNCRVDVQPTDSFCDECGAGFTVEPDRQSLGLGAVHLLPGQATPQSIAEAGQPVVGARPDNVADVPSVPENAAPSLDFAPLVHALRRKVRRQRWVIALLLLTAVGGAGAAVWLIAPAGSIERWLDQQGIRFGSTPTAAPGPARPVGSPTAAPAVSAQETPTPVRDKVEEPSPAEAPVSHTMPPAPPAPEASKPNPDPRAGDVELPPGLVLEDHPEALEHAAGALGDRPDLRAMVRRRGVQVRLRQFP